jgi:hypothetical protein
MDTPISTIFTVILVLFVVALFCLSPIIGRFFEKKEPGDDSK